MPMNRARSIVLAVLFALARASAPAQGSDAGGGGDFEGTLEVMAVDDFDSGQGRIDYYLVTGEERLLLVFDGALAPSNDWRTGDHMRIEGVRVEGVRIDGARASSDRISVSAAERISVATHLGPDAPNPWATGPKKVLVILVNFTNDTSQPYTVAQAQNTMFGASGSVAAYYNETSWGSTTLTGNVTPWLTLPMAKPTTCDTGNIQTKATTAAQNAGYVLANYNFPMYVFPHISACGWAGLGYVGFGGSWINQALSTYVAGHELGHNYGVLHGHSYDCGASAFSASCSRSEYGDPFDIMGGNTRHFSAYSKNYFGWLPDASVVSLSTGTTDVDISPIESSSGARAIKLSTTVGRTYWVELRQQTTGFDAGFSAAVTNGAQIRIAPSPASGTDLLDATPDGSFSASFGDATIPLGQSFIDPAAGLTVTPTVKNGSVLTVHVDYGTFPTPALGAATPPAGTSAGGSSTILSGSGFLPGATVTIGGAAATPTAISGGSVTVKAGAHAVGDADVVLTNADGKSSTLTKGFFYDFADVTGTNPLRPFVVKLFHDSITAGCGGVNYCPSSAVTRGQMAVFLLKSEHGSAYTPPPATGTVFADVPLSNTFAPWIEQLHAESVTGGCATNPLRYCPTSPVTRDQMAVLLLTTKHGSAYVPPPATGIFSDVPASSGFARWIEELYTEGITGGCGTAPLRYCPGSSATRGQMAVFLVTAFSLP